MKETLVVSVLGGDDGWVAWLQQELDRFGSGFKTDGTPETADCCFAVMPEVDAAAPPCPRTVALIGSNDPARMTAYLQAGYLDCVSREQPANLAMALYRIGKELELQAALDSSEKRYRNLFHAMHNGVAYCRLERDASGKPVDYRYLEVNDPFCTIMQTAREELEGKLVFQLFPWIPEEPFGWLQWICSALHDRKTVTTEQLVTLINRWLRLSVQPEERDCFWLVVEETTEQHRVEQQLVESRSLLKEVHHRVKNNLQIIQSLLSLQFAELADEPLRLLFQESVNRIQAMARLHEQLYQSGQFSSVELSRYLQDLVHSALGVYPGHPLRPRFRLEPARLDLERALPLGLICHELTAHALLQAYHTGRSGVLEIVLRRREDGLEFRIDDSGCSFECEDDGGESLGLQLVELLCRQLHGKLELYPGGAGILVPE